MKSENIQGALFLLVAALGVMAATPASAQFYVGAGVGQSNATGLTASGAATATKNYSATLDASANSWKLYGGYQFTPIWGVEVQYSDLGTRSGNMAFTGAVVGNAKLTTSTASQWGIAGTGTLPINNDFYLMGKLGATSNSTGDLTATVGTTSATAKGTSNTDLLAGVGAGYNFTKNLGVRLEYENFGKLGSGSSIRADNWSISLKASF